MGVTSDIVESWHHPARVVRRHLDRSFPAAASGRPGEAAGSVAGKSEAFAFTFLFVFLLVAFVGQWPGASRAAFLQPAVPLFQRLLAAGLGLLATIPLWYGLAGLSHLVGRAFGGRGSWYGARIALFWALATISPAMLLHGLIIGFLGPGAQANVLGVLVALAFLILWMSMLIEAERG